MYTCTPVASERLVTVKPVSRRAHENSCRTLIWGSTGTKPMADDEELEALRKAVLNEPRNGELRYLLAAEMAERKDFDGAVLEFSAAIALNPYLHVARLQLGLLHLTLAQPQHTLAVLAPLEALDESSALKHFKWALEALIADDFGACTTHLKRGIELNLENQPLNRDMSLLLQRVTAALQEQSSKVQPQVEGEEAVRTDFSLYGVTKH